MNPLKFLAAKTWAAGAAGALAAAAQAGGIPVIDAGNLREAMAQTLQQIEQLKTQSAQLKHMEQNTKAPDAYLWDQAATTMEQLRQAMATLEHYQQQAGGLEAYLAQFQDLAHYRRAPCVHSACAAGEGAQAARATARDTTQLGSQAQKKANDALLRGLDHQHNAVQADARQLQRLQSHAQGATGQMQASGFANQLASHQAHQLLQIRGLLIAEQNAVATRQQVLADREARQQAALEAALAPRIQRTAQPLNWLGIQP